MKPFFALCRLWLVLFCCAAAGPALAQRFEWAKPLEEAPAALTDNGASVEFINRSVTDQRGNSYVTGSFTGALTLGDTTLLSSTANESMFVARFDSTGSLSWVFTGYSPGGHARGRALALDMAGNPVVAVDCDDSLAIGSLSTPGNCLLLALTATGSLTRTIPLPTQDLRLNGWVVNPVTEGLAAADGRFFVFLKGMASGGVGSGEVMCLTTAGRLLWERNVMSSPNAINFNVSCFDATASGDIVLVQDDASVTYQTDSIGSQFAPGCNVMRWDHHGIFRPWPAANCGLTPFAVRQDRTGNTYLLEGQRNELYLTKFLATDQLVWRKKVLEGEFDDFGFVRQQTFTVDAAGSATILATYHGRAHSDFFLLPPTTSLDLIILQLDVNGNTRNVMRGAGSADERALTLNADRWGNLYLYGITHSPDALGGLLPSSSAMPANGRCFLAKINAQAARVRGQAYLDQNANGHRDGGEPLFSGRLEIQQSQHATITTTELQNAYFELALDTGAYQVQLVTVPLYYTLTQGAGGYSGHLTSYGQVDTARHFGLAPVANQPDLRVTLTPFAPARRNRHLRYRALVENVGTTAISSGQLRVQLDPAATLVSTTPVASQQAGPSVQWDFQQLAPRQSRTFDFVLTLPTSRPLGAPVLTTAAVTPLAGDLVPADNADSLRQTVVGSFDPNDLAVNYDTLTLAQVQQGTPLDYMLRFQNLGTDTAFSVLMVDTLPSRYLQLNTLRLLGQSHTATWGVVGDVLQVQFSNIGLPHKAVDSLGSQGFVRFRVTPRATLTPGTLIPNRAHIYFDFNAPVATNAVTTLILGVTGLPRETTTAGLSVYPNPAANQVALSADLATAGTVRVQLRDALGRVVQAATFPASAGRLRRALDLAGVTPGLYVVQMTLPDGRTTARRLVVGE